MSVYFKPHFYTLEFKRQQKQFEGDKTLAHLREVLPRER